MSWRNTLLLAVVSFPFASSIGAQVVINEVVASNRRSLFDDERDTPDWVELRNVGREPVSLRGAALSDDVDDPGKWRFPEVVLQPGAALVVFCSEKDRLRPAAGAVEAADSTLPFEPRLVSPAAPWRYTTGAAGEPLPQGWQNPAFDDAAWSVGVPGFGFGDDDDATLLPMEIGGALFRHRFTVDDPSAVLNLVFEALYDDGLVLYLNGERLLSVNFPADEEPLFGSRAGGSREARAPERFDLSAHQGLLRPGDNLLAIFLLNSTLRSNDLSLVPALGTVGPVFHTNFKLKKGGGEVLTLTSAAGALLDLVALPVQTEDRSYGRFPDGSGDFFYMLVPTPGALNGAEVSAHPLDAEPRFSPESGRWSAPTTVTISAAIPFEGFELRYTLNGEPPHSESPVYDGPLTLTGDTVVRVAGYLGGREVLAPETRGFFGLEPVSADLSLPTLSLAIAPDEFVPLHADDLGRGRASERQAHLEILEADGTRRAATGVGLRLHGGAGRGGGLARKKSYRLYFRSQYGNARLRYPIIPEADAEDFDVLVLRANFNDAFGGGKAYLRDQVIRDLHADMGGWASRGAWYNLFVNMEYRGVYNVVERLDKSFFRSTFPEESEDWDVIKTGGDVLDGSDFEWARLLNFFASSDLSDETLYARALELIDVENFTSYFLLNLWAQNHDWPHNNWYAARPRRSGGRWLFLSWDAEFGLGLIPAGFSANTFSHALERADAPATVLVAALLGNPDYRAFFLDELRRHLEGALSPENALSHVQRQRRLLAPDMNEEVEISGGTRALWEANVDAVELFARSRGERLRTFVLGSELFRPQEETIPPEPFLRGDANGDGVWDVTDVMEIVRVLAGAPSVKACDAALDANDSGRVNAADAVFLLDFLFRARGASTPPPPFPDCGPDPTTVGVACEGIRSCQGSR